MTVYGLRELYATGAITLDEFEVRVEVALRTEPRERKPQARYRRRYGGTVSARDAGLNWSAAATQAATKYQEGVAAFANNAPSSA